MQYDKSHQHLEFKAGDLLRRNHPLSNAASGFAASLAVRWEGPNEVKTRISRLSYRLARRDTNEGFGSVPIADFCRRDCDRKLIIFRCSNSVLFAQNAFLEGSPREAPLRRPTMQVGTRASLFPKELRMAGTVSANQTFGVADHGQTADLGNAEGAQRAPRARQAGERPRRRVCTWDSW